MAKKSSVPERLRRQVQERAQGRCEYCLMHESDMYYPHEADHVIAEKHGGPTSLDNLAWACFYCNRFKGSDLASVDPISNKVVFLFYVDTCQEAERLLFLQGSQERRGSAWLHCWRHRASVRGLF